MSFNRLHIFVLPVLVSLLAVACEEPSYINGPGENLFNQDSIIPVVEPEPMPDPEPTPDPEGFEIPEGTLNVYEARNICAQLESGQTTGQK